MMNYKILIKHGVNGAIDYYYYYVDDDDTVAFQTNDKEVLKNKIHFLLTETDINKKDIKIVADVDYEISIEI